MKTKKILRKKKILSRCLNKELEGEREKRKTIDNNFKNQFDQIQTQIKQLKVSSTKEKSREINQDLHQESLDLIPTRDKPIPKNKSHSFKTEKHIPYQSPFGKPKISNTLYKNVPSRYKEQSKKLESAGPPKEMFAINEELKEKMKTPEKKSPTKSNPEMSPVKSQSKSPARSLKSLVSSKASLKKKSSIANAAITMMHKKEIERQMQLELEKDIAIDILSKFKQNPNLEMHKVQKELERVNQRLNPIMEQIDQQITNVGFTKRLKDQANAIGMISKIAGRYISFYSDDLADMLIDDILEETIYEMQKVENQVKKTYMNDQQKIIAEEVMKMAIDYDNEIDIAFKKTDQILQNIPSQKQKVSYGAKEKRGVRFEINDKGIDEIHSSKEIQSKGYVNPFTSAIQKALDEEEYEDDFEEESKDNKSKGAKANQKKVETKRNAKRIFIESQDEIIKIDGKRMDEPEEPIFRWKSKIPGYMKDNIQKYRKEFEKFLVIHNNTSNKEVWKIYDHITLDIFDEIFTDVCKDFENIEDY